ncbi:Hypothetical predicted protein, partial [Pelobates cultripes]
MEEEIKQAIKTAKIGKTLDPDGLPNDYYKKLGHNLIPRLTKALNRLTDRTCFHKEFLVATITVIPKPGKNPENSRNFHRPLCLSLMRSSSEAPLQQASNMSCP